MNGEVLVNAQNSMADKCGCYVKSVNVNGPLNAATLRRRAAMQLILTYSNEEDVRIACAGIIPARSQRVAGLLFLRAPPRLRSSCARPEVRAAGGTFKTARPHMVAPEMYELERIADPPERVHAQLAQPEDPE
jgi:hypothetical protein